jgi:hypothetical protein
MNKENSQLATDGRLMEINALRLSFTMELLCVTKQLEADFQRQRAEAKAARDQQQTDESSVVAAG